MPDQSLRVPAFCPICSGLMMGRSTYSWYDYGTCVNCFIYFIEGRVQRWKEGWRPSAEELCRYKEIAEDKDKIDVSSLVTDEM